MALIPCPECNNQISDTAFKCPSCGVTIRKPRRSFLGKVFMGLFIVFNLLMAGWLFSYWSALGEMMTLDDPSGAAQAGSIIGSTIGTGVIFAFWALGDIILGMLVLFTRPRS